MALTMKGPHLTISFHVPSVPPYHQCLHMFALFLDLFVPLVVPCSVPYLGFGYMCHQVYHKVICANGKNVTA